MFVVYISSVLVNYAYENWNMYILLGIRVWDNSPPAMLAEFIAI